MPPVMMNLRVELRRDAGKISAATGPWIRRKQIARIDGVPSPDAIAQVLTKKGEPLGWGLYSPQSVIAVRVLDFTAAPPEDWLQQRLARAWRARDAYDFERQGTSGYRLVNSEGDGLPGLVIDKYGDDLVVQITTAPMAVRRDQIDAWLEGQGHTRRITVLPEGAAKLEGFEPALVRTPAIEGDGDAKRLRFTEHGLYFETLAPPAQKTGAYLDQRNNRQAVAALAATHRGALLDVGCHVGGFALHAAARGVKVVGVDRSLPALEQARRNADKMSTNSTKVDTTWVEADMFGPLDDPALRGPFGTIVLDPPKVATSRNNVDRAVKAIGKLVGRMGHRLSVGGHLVVCSCSHHLGRDHLDRVMATSTGSWTRVATWGAGVDHPVCPGHREGEYLRVHAYQLRDR